MAATAFGGNPSAAIAAMMRKKLGGGDIDVTTTTLEVVTRPASAKKTAIDDGQEVKLTHMTKGRAKGPKRRLPTTATALPVASSEKQSTANKVKFAKSEISSTRSTPTLTEKPATITPLSTKSYSFPSGPRNSLVSQRSAMFSSSDSSASGARSKNASTSAAKAYQVPTTTSGPSKSAMTFNATADKPKPTTAAKPAFGVLKSGDKARPVSLIFPPQKSSEYEHVVDHTTRQQPPTYKQRPVIPDKPKLQALRGSSYSATVSTTKEVEAPGPLKKMQSFPVPSPKPKPKPESLMNDRRWDSKSGMTTAAAEKPLFMSTPALTLKAASSIDDKKQQPILRPKPVSIVKSIFESKEDAPELSPTSWRSPPKPDPARKPSIFHSRSKSYSGHSNIERPTLPPKPKALFSRHNTDEEEKVAHKNIAAVVHNHEMSAIAPATKPRSVSFLWGGRSVAPTSEASFSQPKATALGIWPKPLLEATGRPVPATEPKIYKQKDSLREESLISRTSDLPSASTQNTKPPRPSKPKPAGSTVVREPPILAILPKPVVREHEPVVSSKLSVRDRVSNWEVPSSTASTKGSTTITMLRAQTPLVS
ncbi:hypothetical protein V1525DRAFT_205 [Lipomyces kononenkoae]|uniref:Uncharacterized protein n=1 Tax=Lipomyces kononenkoae TaxID=34357 RepID=A0ACC3TB50_LIPKO